MDFISLSELNAQIKQTVKERFREPVWITAEVASVQENRSGHCYLELVEKPEGEEVVLAVAKGTIWAFTYRMLKPYFETTTGRSLEKGMKVLLNAEVVFHEVYGFSLNIKDVDPTFTIGDIERKRREIIGQLEQDGIIDMNRELEFPALPKNVAVISSPTAAGLGDFLNQIENNSYGYRFHVKLFPALMQGERTADSVIAALDRIYGYEELFDVVVIIRGGGSQTDLGSFDSYELAANVAQFPLPVIAGIGHERDETIVDRVAYMRVKTPTAAAAFLIECFLDADMQLEEMKEEFLDGVEELLAGERSRQQLAGAGLKKSVQLLLMSHRSRLGDVSRKAEHLSKLYIYDRMAGFKQLKSRLEGRMEMLFSRQSDRLKVQQEKLGRGCREVVEKQQRALELAEVTVKYADPKKVLERGYSITRLNGRSLKDVTELRAGDVLDTEVAQGKIISVVKETNK